MSDSRNPIKIDLITKNELKVAIKMDSWEISKVVNDRALKDLKDKIEDVFGLTKIAEAFECDGKDAEAIKKFWDSSKNWELCNKCELKWNKCYDCVIKCDSPLERDLLLNLSEKGLEPIMQM